MKRGVANQVAPDIEQSVACAALFEIPKIDSMKKVVCRTGYAITFDTTNHLAKWVSYNLSKEKLDHPVAERAKTFSKDPDFESSTPAQYRKSGYHQGHLAAAADMRWSVQAMNESFYHGNITPQLPHLNVGVWKQLEDQVRIWAMEYGEIYITTGPVLESQLNKLPGTEVSLPKRFYKVILEKNGPEVRAIGFVIPQEYTGDLNSFVVSVDEVERLTGIDFFAGLPDDIENAVEASADIEKWASHKNNPARVMASKPTSR